MPLTASFSPSCSVLLPFSFSGLTTSLLLLHHCWQPAYRQSSFSILRGGAPSTVSYVLLLVPLVPRVLSSSARLEYVACKEEGKKGDKKKQLGNIIPEIEE